MPTFLVSNILKFLPTKYLYLVLGLAVVAFLGYAYYTHKNTLLENQILKQNVLTLKQNEKEIIEAYEYSIREIETKTKIETENKASKANYEKAIIRLNKTKKESKHEVNTDTNIIDFNF